MRYGNVPAGMVDAKPIPVDRIKISVDVYMKGAIQNMTSPSHPTFALVHDGSLDALPHTNNWTGEYSSPSFLSQDFVLSITAQDLDAARCFAERDHSGTVAMQLTVVPKFKLPPIQTQEYIFLVDRSGSMGGDKIRTAKRALVMLLRALPSQGTTFNISSFGSRCSSLWERSMSYNKQTLNQATSHVDSMAADYGGTEIREALERMFKTRSTHLPTSCFVLTDGGAWDIEATIATVSDAVAQAKIDAPLRVFTLGIGAIASTAMCNGIARAGNGICLMSSTSESILAKCAKLVKASRTEILEDATVDWGLPPRPLDSFTRTSQRSVVLRQGPKTLPSISGGNRFVAFAMINHERFVIPKEVDIQAKSSRTGETLRFAVPVQELSNTTEGPQRPLIHTLAARRIIMDLEDREKGDVSPNVKKIIIQLGEQYQLASRFTSFVAVENPSHKEPEPVPPPQAQLRGIDIFERIVVPVPPMQTPTVAPVAQKPAVLASVASVVPPVPVVIQASARSVSPSGVSVVAQRSCSQPVDHSAESGRHSPPEFMEPRYLHHTPQIIPSSMFEQDSPPLPQLSYPLVRRSPSPHRDHSQLDIDTDMAIIAPHPTILPLVPSPPQFHWQARPSLIRGPSLQFRSPSPVAVVGTPMAARAPAPILIDTICRSRSSSVRARWASSPRLSHSPSLSRNPEDCQARNLLPSPVHIAPCNIAQYQSSVQVGYLETKDDVEQLVRLQSFDGSFPSTEELAAILGADILAEAEKRKIDQTVWATVVAIAYLQKMFVDQPELLEGLAEKAMEFVEQVPGVDFNALLEVAKELIV